MIYQKSYVPPNTVGFKQGNLGSVFRVGYKAAGQVLSLGNKAKQFYEKYGAHVPQVAEKVRELEPYFNKAMEGAAKVRNTLEKSKRRSHNSDTQLSINQKPSGGSQSRPGVHRRGKHAQHEKRVRHRSSHAFSF